MTASTDRSVRCTSIVRDSRSFELSQGSLSKKATNLDIPVASLKLPAITALSYSTTRAKDWDDILTAHSDDTYSRTWSMPNKRKGKHDFSQADVGKPRTLGTVKVVCVSACGNFGLAGSSTGAIGMWNMQSGMHRKTFELRALPPDAVGRSRSSGKMTRERCVTGLATDALNRSVIVGTLDGTLNVCSIFLFLRFINTILVLRFPYGGSRAYGYSPRFRCIHHATT